MLKLLHAADLHLDSPFSGLTPEQAAQSRAEQRQLLERMGDVCSSHGCDLLLLAGDLFDSTRVYRDTLDVLREVLRGCGAQVLIAPGNHDPLVPGSPYLTESWPENVHIFPAGLITEKVFPGLDCRVYGAGFGSTRSGSLLEGFHATQDGLLPLMVLHGDATGGQDCNPITAAQIAGSGLRYLALGHIHRRGQQMQNATLCAWPGCMMGRGFDETGEKGVLEWSADGEDSTLCFVPLGARRYEIRRIEIGDDPLASILSAIPADDGQEICRILLHGESAGVDLLALRNALQNRFFALELQDRTVPPLELWQTSDNASLKGRFLNAMRARLDVADGDDREIVQYALRAGLALLEGREVPPL